MKQPLAGHMVVSLYVRGTVGGCGLYSVYVSCGLPCPAAVAYKLQTPTRAATMKDRICVGVGGGEVHGTAASFSLQLFTYHT